jgi:hypothetical protein
VDHKGVALGLVGETWTLLGGGQGAKDSLSFASVFEDRQPLVKRAASEDQSNQVAADRRDNRFWRNKYQPGPLA